MMDINILSIANYLEDQFDYPIYPFELKVLPRVIPITNIVNNKCYLYVYAEMAMQINWSAKKFIELLNDGRRESVTWLDYDDRKLPRLTQRFISPRPGDDAILGSHFGPALLSRLMMTIWEMIDHRDIRAPIPDQFLNLKKNMGAGTTLGGPYVGITLEAEVRHPDCKSIVLIDHTPATTDIVLEVTDDIGFTFGGKLNFSSGKPTAELSVTYSVSQSRKRAVPPLKVTNLSRAPQSERFCVDFGSRDGFSANTDLEAMALWRLEFSSPPELNQCELWFSVTPDTMRVRNLTADLSARNRRTRRLPIPTVVSDQADKLAHWEDDLLHAYLLKLCSEEQAYDVIAGVEERTLHIDIPSWPSR